MGNEGLKSKQWQYIQHTGYEIENEMIAVHINVPVTVIISKNTVIYVPVLFTSTYRVPEPIRLKVYYDERE